jgi:phosphoribosyl 1,2-cyclic phosphate phosphodiesterase
MTHGLETRVTFLGTGTSVGVPVPTCVCHVCRSNDPRDARLRPSVLLEWSDASVLIDSSSDLRAQALRHDIRRVDAVLYTHAHADHILGLDDLRLYNWKQGCPVPAYGNRETLDALRKTFWYVFDQERTESTRPSIELRVVDSRFPLLGRVIVPVPVMHGPLPILGYRVGAFAYLTDVSEIPEGGFELLHDLEVLVLDALRERPHPMHLSLQQALDLAARIGARKTYFTHMTHEVHHATVSKKLPPGVALAHDGLSVVVPARPEPAP